MTVRLTDDWNHINVKVEYHLNKSDRFTKCSFNPFSLVPFLDSNAKKNQLENNISKFNFFSTYCLREFFLMFSYFKCKLVLSRKCFSHFGMFRQLVNVLWISKKNSKYLFKVQFSSISFYFHSLCRFCCEWLIWIDNHRIVNIVFINLIAGTIIISVKCFNNFFVFVAKYQVNSRPRLSVHKYFVKNLFFCWSAFFLLLFNISRAVNFCFSVWKFRGGRDKNKWLFVSLCKFDVQ